jgi:hypothetical protein
LAKLAFRGGARAIAEYFDSGLACGQLFAARELGHAPLFALCWMCRGNDASARDVWAGSEDVAGRLERRRLILGSEGGIRPELRSYIADLTKHLEQSVGNPVGRISPAPSQSAKINALLLDAYVSMGLDRTRLPPRFPVLVTLVQIASRDRKLSREIKSDLSELAALVTNSEEPSADALLRLWRELSTHTLEALANARSRLTKFLVRDGLDSVDPYLHDPRFDLLAARQALLTAPDRASAKKWPSELATDLLQLHSSISLPANRRIKRPQGKPSGVGHEFAVAAFRLYDLPLTGVASGLYLRTHRSRCVR